MGYELHITRRTDWMDDEQTETDISLEEWLAYLEQDDELELSNDYWIRVPGSKTESMVSPGSGKWTKHPTDDDLGFYYFQGRIIIKDPDNITIKKMLSISKKLRAYVQGNDRETYEVSTDGEIIIRILEDEPIPQKTWWKFW